MNSGTKGEGTGRVRSKKVDMSDERVRERNVRSILNTTAELMAEKGFDGVSMLEIANRTGLPRANVYYYFPTKEDIYRALLGELINGWEVALRHLSVDRQPAEALGDYIKSKLDYCRRNPVSSRLFANEILGGAKFLTRRDRDYMHALTRERLGVLEHWMETGQLRRTNARHLLMMLWGATQFLSISEPLACDTLEVKKLKAADFDVAASTIIDITLQGLLP